MLFRAVPSRAELILKTQGKLWNLTHKTSFDVEEKFPAGKIDQRNDMKTDKREYRNILF